jgi:adenylate cyclase
VDLAGRFAELGVTKAEMDQARASGTIDELAIERVVLPGARRYDQRALAQEAGIKLDVLRRLWRAMGFPDPDPRERLFTDMDLQALRDASGELTDGDAERALQSIRTICSALSRVAEMTADEWVAQRAAAIDAGSDPDDVAEVILADADMERSGRLMFHIYRRMLLAALRRRLTTGDGTAEATLSVGFIDMVGFTALVEELDEDELAAVVTDFETRTHDTVAEMGGRIVKTIGDEVMFVTDQPARAIEIALRLAGDTRRGPYTPDVRAGLAYGPVLAREGDYFGSVVNLASRLVTLAYPGRVLASSAVHDVVADDPRWQWRFLQPRRLKGLGRVPVWAVRSSTEPATTR